MISRVQTPVGKLHIKLNNFYISREGEYILTPIEYYLIRSLMYRKYGKKRRKLQKKRYKKAKRQYNRKKYCIDIFSSNERDPVFDQPLSYMIKSTASSQSPTAEMVIYDIRQK